jgi:NDP-sugar pyrophosphorylase family protein
LAGGATAGNTRQFGRRNNEEPNRTRTTRIHVVVRDYSPRAGQSDANGDGFGHACVSPTVFIPSTADIGANPIIGSGTVINSGVSLGANAKIGANVILNKLVRGGTNLAIGDGTKIDQGTQLGENVSIGSNVSIEKNRRDWIRCRDRRFHNYWHWFDYGIERADWEQREIGRERGCGRRRSSAEWNTCRRQKIGPVRNSRA